MPLVVICGTPLSGKSYRAKQLYEHLNQHTECGKCVLVSDEDQLTDHGPNQIYKSASHEKELRSWLKSQVQRNLSNPDTIVILDAANYIKGYRYELYCLSKQFRTTHVVIECEQAPAQIVESKLTTIDGDLQDKRSYSPEIFNELVQRFEKPDSNNRWDSPLFQIAYNDLSGPLEEIKDAALKRAALKPNQSTQSMPITTDNFLYELDIQTQDVIKQIQISLQSSQLRGIKIKNSDVPINLVKKMPIAELNKFRRQFLNYTRTHPFNDKDRIVSAFVQFINKSVS